MKNLIFLVLFLSFNTVQAQVITLKENYHPVKSLALCENGRRLISGASVIGNPTYGQLIMWDLESYKPIFKKQTNNNTLETIVCGQFIFTAGGSFIDIFDVKGKKVVRRQSSGSIRKGINHLLLDNNFNIIATNAKNRIRFLTLNLNAEYYSDLLKLNYLIDDEPVSDIIALEGKSRFIASNHFVTASTDKKNINTIKVWKISNSLKVVKKIVVENSIRSLEQLSDSLVLAADTKGKVNIWNVNTGKMHKTILHLSQNINKIRLSQDKSLLAVVSNQEVYIYDTENGQLLETLQGHTAKINDILFMKDDRHIASASDDRTIKIWKTLSNQTYIKKQVAQKIRAWKMKSEFEKTSTYLERMKRENVDKKIEELTQKAINKLAIQENKVVWKIIENQYDADNEVFKLKIEGIEEIKLKVPVSEAKVFSNNIDNLLLTDPHFTLTSEDTFHLAHLLITNPKNTQTYNYNPHNILQFQVQNIQVPIKPLEVNIETVDTPKKTKEVSKKEHIGIEESIGQNLPKTLNQNPDGVAVIIGNKDYDNTKSVDFAINDAKLMKKYLIEVLGYKEGNILYVENASLADFKMIFGDKNMYEGQLFNMVKAQKSEVFIYYSGHGVPSLKNKQGYFVPKECNTQYVELTGYSLNTFYENLAKIPTTSLTVVLDACFSGTNIYENISPIDVKSKGILGIKKGVLFASSSGTEVSCWYNEKKQGLFTYFFLKAIHNQNADFNKDNKITFEEIQQYISDKTEGVPYYARRLHGIIQNPVLQGENTENTFVEYLK